MKKISILFVILMASIAVNATIWRVNNNPGITTYTSFSEAQSVAANGDTLYIEGSLVSYGDIFVTKQLTIIGPGYFLTQNPQTQANPVIAQFEKVKFNEGSSFSILSGIVVNGSTYINVGNILIKGNFCNGGIVLNSNLNHDSISNIFIFNNWINTGSDYWGGISSGGGVNNNVIVSNNYIGGTYTFLMNGSCTCIINNNILRFGSHLISNSTFSNNIQLEGGSNPSDNYYYNNIGSGTQFPNNNGNQQNVDMSLVFVGATGNSTDGKYQLKPGSPAIGAGNDGTDCGMFGGTMPYVLSGLPQIPAIYEIDMPASGNNVSGINVTVKAKSH